MDLYLLKKITDSDCWYFVRKARNEGFTFQQSVFILSGYVPPTRIGYSNNTEAASQYSELPESMRRVGEVLLDFYDDKHPELIEDIDQSRAFSIKESLGLGVRHCIFAGLNSEIHDTFRYYTNLNLVALIEAAEYLGLTTIKEYEPKILQYIRAMLYAQESKLDTDGKNEPCEADNAKSDAMAADSQSVKNVSEANEQERRGVFLAQWLEKQEQANPAFDRSYITQKKQFVWEELNRIDPGLFPHREFIKGELPPIVKAFFKYQKLCMFKSGRR